MPLTVCVAGQKAADIMQGDAKEGTTGELSNQLLHVLQQTQTISRLLHKPTDPESFPPLVGAATYPLVVVHNAAPVQHVHHGLEAEDGLLVQLVITRHREGSGCRHDRLVSLYPCKLLLPNLKHNMV